MNIAMNFLVVKACVFQFYQLPSCNSFTQQLCFIIFGDIPLVKPWPPVHSFTLITTLFTCFSSLLACWSVFTFVALNHVSHTIRLILYFQQEGKIDNLPGSLGTREFCVLCVRPFNLTEDLCSYGFDNFGFIIEGNLLLHYIIPSTWGSQRTSVDASSQFLAPLPGSISFCKGSYTLPMYFLCYCSCLVSFYLSLFCLFTCSKNKNPKKLEFQQLVFFCLCC